MEDQQKNKEKPFDQDNDILEQLKQIDLDLPKTQVRIRQKKLVLSKKLKKMKQFLYFYIHNKQYQNLNKLQKLPIFSKNFQPARRITLQQMIVKDKQDPSLENYKKTLLGDVDESEVAQQRTTEVEIVKIEIVCKNKPEGNIILDFSQPEKEKFIIKEGSIYFMTVYFKVRYDCVYGLRFVNNVWRHFIKVDRYEEMMGSFAPKTDIQQIDLSPEEAPLGIFGRGTYKGKIMFLDNDGIVHMQFKYNCKICKEWVK